MVLEKLCYIGELKDNWYSIYIVILKVSAGGPSINDEFYVKE